MGRVATTDLAADEAAVPEAVDHVPAAVSDALELLTAPPHPSSASWAVQTAVWADRRIDDDDAAVWVEEELRVIEAVERSRRGPTSRVSLPPDGCGRRCTSRCAPTTTLEHLHQAPVLSPEVVSAESLTATVDETALATGLPTWEVARRLELAADAGGRGAGVLAALAGGEVTLDRALRIHRETERLGTEVALAVSERLLAPGRDGTIRSMRRSGVSCAVR
jgi:hypothetical protein